MVKGRAGQNGANYRRYHLNVSNAENFTIEIDHDPNYKLQESQSNFNGNYKIVYSERNGSFLNSFIDGPLADSMNIGSDYGSIDENSPTDLHLGRKSYSSSNLAHFKGEMVEVVMFQKALGSNERQQIFNYLSRKWGLDDSTDSDGDGQMDLSDADPAGSISSMKTVDFVIQ